MPTIKLTYEEQLQRDIDQLDDRLERLQLHEQPEQAKRVQVERQRLIDELGELALANALTKPQTQPLMWASG